jgi:hypothetical protein
MPDRRRRTRRCYTFAVALLASLALALVGCSSERDGSGTDLSDAAVAPSPLEQARDATTAACDSAPVFDVAIIDGQVFTQVEEVVAELGTPFNVVVQTDAALQVKLSGSVSPTIEIGKGISSICTLYNNAGTFYVEVDSRIVATVVITDPSVVLEETNEVVSPGRVGGGTSPEVLVE